MYKLVASAFLLEASRKTAMEAFFLDFQKNGGILFSLFNSLGEVKSCRHLGWSEKFKLDGNLLKF